MRRYLTLALIVSVVALLLALTAAQSNLGNLHGIVKDQSGAPLVGVAVKLSRGTAAVDSTFSDRTRGLPVEHA